MPTVNLNKKKVLEYIGKDITDKVLFEKIPMIGTDLEGITDDEISVEIFPNRPDMLSEEGFARAFKSFLGLEKGLRKYVVNKSDYKATIDSSVKEVREFAVAAVIKGVNVDSDFIARLMQVQEKLHTTHSRNRKSAAIGVHDLDTVSFPINYTTRGKDFSFIPLEGKAEMTIEAILTEHPKGKAYAHLVDKDVYPVWIDAEDKVVSFPPIINGIHTTVTSDTKNLLLDITGTDEKVVVQALNIMVSMLSDAGGKIYEVDVSGNKYPDFTANVMKLDLSYANRLLGLELDAESAIDYLLMMGLGAKKVSESIVEVSIPVFRTDILHSMDLIEDIAIAYGYENFDSEMSDATTVGAESSKTVFSRKVSELLVGLSYLECKSFHMTNAKTLFEKMNHEVSKDIVRTANAVNIEYDAMRDRLLSGLMKILSENTHNEYPQNLFEAGTVISKDDSAETNVSEDTNIALVSAGLTSDFSSMKAVIETFALNLDVDIRFEEHEDPSFISGRCAKLVLSGAMIGVVGELHPEVLVNWGLDVPVAAAEIDLLIVMDAVFK
ncbi:MAG: phenylalanine--tRNA ligase subunit beta [Nanohaloarchaea archaeon]|nr:phenylalanine--tRNA ligase subunit beta [Candidatus Nanohaloarchaea archaeon]